MSGFQVDPQQLADAGSRAAGKTQEAQGIQQKVAAADGQVPEKAWGLLGDMTVYHCYTSVLGTFSDHLAELVPGVQKLGDDIKATAELYQQNEAETAQKFTDIGNDLSDAAASAPPGAGKAV